MKKIALITLLLALSIQSITSQNQTVKDSLINAFDNRPQDLDPMEGIWVFGMTKRIYDIDSLISESRDYSTSEFSISKKNKISFNIFKINESDNSLDSYPAYFEKIAIKNKYTVNRFFNKNSEEVKTIAEVIDNNYFQYTIKAPESFFKKSKEYNPDRVMYLTYFGFKKYPFAAVSDKSPNIDWKVSGSGLVIDKRGYIVTNHHVIKNADTIHVELTKDGKKYRYLAKVVVKDKKHDLAILKVTDHKPLPFYSIPFKISESQSLIGTQVFALGYPLPVLMGREIKFTEGRISSQNGSAGDIASFQFSAPLQPGNSGGPLFDFEGNLVGINFAHIKPDYADNVAYAIKPVYLFNLAQKLPERPSLRYQNTMKNRNFKQKIELLSQYVVFIMVK